jgi:hypothetical protein
MDCLSRLCKTISTDALCGGRRGGKDRDCHSCLGRDLLHKDELDPMTFVGKAIEGITMTEENCDFAKQYLDAIFAIQLSLNGIVMVT